MKAAVTGWSWRTPLGADPGEVFDRLVAGEGAACRHAAPYDVAWGCPLPGAPWPSRASRFLRRMGCFALECGQEALARSGAVPGDRLGVFLAYGGLRAHWNDMMPALASQLPDARECWDRGLRLLHPFWMLQHLSNNAQALLATACAARGGGATCGGAHAGAQAIASAQRALASGALDAALVVAHDTLLEPETLVELGTRARGAARDAVRAPYGPGGRGFLPGEAAAALVLERPEAAGSRCLAYVHAEDGADGSREEPSARLLGILAARALEGRRPGVVDGAARAWEDLDDGEREALAEVAGPDTPLMATQAALGHLGAAAGLVQAILLARALDRGILPPVHGLEAPRPGPLRPLAAPLATEARCGLALATGAPGLAGAIRVEAP